MCKTFDLFEIMSLTRVTKVSVTKHILLKLVEYDTSYTFVSSSTDLQYKHANIMRYNKVFFLSQMK